MQYQKSQLLVIITIAISFVLNNVSCYKKPHGNSFVITHFPTQVGNSWEYQRTFYMVVYDTINNDTTEYLLLDSLYQEFEDIDTLADWECYRLRHILFEQGDSFPETRWYAHPDTALLWIAYQYNTYDNKSRSSTEEGSNLKFWVGGMSFDSPRALARYLHDVRYAEVLSLNSDTNYWSPPKKLFVFPLEVGKTWVAMTDPWLEEREVVRRDLVTVPAGMFFTLRTQITSEGIGDTDLWYKWIAEEGIIKDSLYIRGTVMDGNDNVVGYFDVNDIYELLEVNTYSQAIHLR